MGRADNLKTMRPQSIAMQTSNKPPAAIGAPEAMNFRLAMEALKSVDAAVSVVDVTAPDQPVVFVNAAFSSLTGYDPSEVLGRNCRFLQHAGTDRTAVAQIREGIAAGRSVQTVMHNRRRDGSTFWNALKLVPLVEDDGRVTHYVGFQHELSDWALAAQIVLSMDEADAGDALARFDQSIATALREQASGRERWVLALLRGTVQGACADLPLPLAQRVSVTRCLRPFLLGGAAIHFPPGATVAVLVPVGDDQMPLSVVAPLLETLQTVWPCRAGMAELGVDGPDAQALLAQGRLACDRAFEQASEEPCYAEEHRDASDRRTQQLLRDVRLALASDQFRLVFQPVVDLANGELKGFEALLRWVHPVLGPVMPGEFIDRLERMPEIGQVTQWVLRTALGHLGRWTSALGRPLRMAVNMPAELLLDDVFTLFVLSELDRQQINPGSLELELTERSLARSSGPALTRLRELQSHGVPIAIDDFGTGWSSLAYLAQLPVSTLKVDQQFTRGVSFSRADGAITRMIVELADGLALRCVAEGIETPGQMRYFADLGCQEGQGYLFARPMEVDAVDCWMLAPAPFIAAELPPVASAVTARHLLNLR
jgi:PAS domain S-box-containing protein